MSWGSPHWGRHRLSVVARFCLAFCGAFLTSTNLLFAHEVRPAYLELTEDVPGSFDVLFKTPMQGDLRLALNVSFSGRVQKTTPVISRMTGDAMVQTWRAKAIEPLTGQDVGIDGLDDTMTDALVRIQFLNGQVWVQRLSPAVTHATIPGAQISLAVAATYVGLGVEHILLGIDHLLFVLGLVLLVKNRWMLVKTITAFTCAHSITLAVAALGYATLPVPPLNAAIALSILFLGPEIVRSWRGGTSLTIRHPWIVALGFGLLHGFGFASGLAQMGLPQRDIPLALLSFNIGVEIGQLGFVGLVLLLERSFRVLEIRWPRWVEAVPAYAVGSLGAFWTIDRVAAMLAGGA
jgi:hydrogenase/urease accessory protein HupE